MVCAVIGNVLAPVLGGRGWVAVACSLLAQAAAQPAGGSRAVLAAARVRPSLTRQLAMRKLAWGDPVFLRAIKEERILELWMRPRHSDQFLLFKQYPVAALSGKLGPKLAEGDRQVPEGFYHVSRRDLNPNSRFHLSFNIGYPNAYDRNHGRTGSLIMVHGGSASVGCLAMTDPAIEEIYSLCEAAIDHGQEFFRIHLFPFRMTAARMARAKGAEWEGFWENLKTGYDWFESRHRPPDVRVDDGKYTFRESP